MSALYSNQKKKVSTPVTIFCLQQVHGAALDEKTLMNQ